MQNKNLLWCEGYRPDTVGDCILPERLKIPFQEYEEGVCLLNNSGFRCIDFSGFCPIVNFKSQTSIFYKNNNILGI